MKRPNPTNKKQQIIIPMSLRRAADEAAYQEAKATGATRDLREEPALTDYIHWRLIENRFPYTIAFSKHDMLVVKRKVATIQELTLDELSELIRLLSKLDSQYDLWFVNTMGRRSVPGRFHLHLVNYVKERGDIQL